MTSETINVKQKPAFSSNQTLIQAAKEILHNNAREGGFTVPSPKLYPFQWLWDSGLVAIGLATYNIERAMAQTKYKRNALYRLKICQQCVKYCYSMAY